MSRGPSHRVLKAERDEIATELEKAQAAKKLLQEDKDKLLHEIANRWAHA